MSDPGTTFALTGEQRARLAALSDVLIPAGAGLPSASKADVHRTGIDQVLRVRSDLVAPLVAALEEAVGEPSDVLRNWRKNHSPLFETFGFLASSAYFMNPRVRALLGYPSRAPVPNPALPDEADFFLDGGILDVVRERGSIYRSAPAD